MVALGGRSMDVASVLFVGALFMQAIAATPAACNEGVDAGCAPSDDGLTSLVQLAKVSADRSKKATDVKSNSPDDDWWREINNVSSDQYMDLTTLEYSNLGNKGPDTSSIAFMRFKRVYTFPLDGGREGHWHLDLRVKAVTEYLPKNESVNGHVGNVGAINMRGGMSTTFRFQLLYTYCDDDLFYRTYGDHDFYGNYYSSLIREGVAKESAEEVEDKEDDNIKLSGSDSDGYLGYYDEYYYYDDYYYYYDDYYYYYSRNNRKPKACQGAVVNRLLVSFYDIDSNRRNMTETVQACHYEHAYLSDNTKLEVVKQEDGQTQFISTTADSTWTGQKVPTDLEALTAKQKAHAVTLEYLNTGSWEVTLATTGSGTTGRNFFFSGVPVFPSCVDHDEDAGETVSCGS